MLYYSKICSERNAGGRFLPPPALFCILIVGGPDMKVLTAMLVVLTTLAVAATALLLFCQAKNAPHYIRIYGGESDAQ